MSQIPFPITRRSVISNITTLFSSSVIAQGMTALALLLTARQLGSSTYGQYAASLVLTSFTAILFNLGLDIWFIREGGRQPASLPELTGSVLAIKGFGGLIWLAIMFILAPMLNPATYPVALFRWTAAVVLLDSLFATTLTAFKASLQNRVTFLLEVSADIAWFLTTLLLIYLNINQPEAYMQVRLLTLLLALVVSLLVLSRLIGLKGTRHTTQLALRKMPPYASSEFLAWASSRADVLIISLTLGKNAVGLYSPAVGLINALYLVPTAIYMVMVPVLSNLYATNVRRARNANKQMILIQLIIGAGLSLFFFLAAPLFVQFLGPTYQASLQIMRILSLILVFKSGSYAMAATLVVLGKQSRRVVVQAIAVAINIIANLFVVYTIGINGVAVVYVVTELFLFIGYTYLVRQAQSTLVTQTLVH